MPFLELLKLKALEGVLPFPLYTTSSKDIFLILSGSGKLRAGIAVSAALALAGCSGHDSLKAPALVVANFGTAGANPNSWRVGQTLLINRLKSSQKKAYLPERLVPWPGEEAECCTVALPQKVPDNSRAVFDMEGFAIAEGVTTFLSSSHLVVAKCVLDIIGADEHDIARLTARLAPDYQAGAKMFLRHALNHQQAILQSSRRILSVSLATSLERVMKSACSSMPLTTTQKRALSQFLKGQLAKSQDLDELEQAEKDWQSRFSSISRVENKLAVKAKLLELMEV